MSYPIFEPTQHDNFKINIVLDDDIRMQTPTRRPSTARRSSSTASSSCSSSKRISYDNLYSDWTTPTDDEGGDGGSSAADLFALLATKTDFNTPAANRDPRAGAWTFDPNAEYDLLIHVQGLLQAQQQQQPQGQALSSSKDPIETAEAILRAIDVYCLGKQWMYHIGASKGEVVSNFLQDCLHEQQHSGREQPFTIVDLGTYCGYSAIVLAKTVLKHSPTPPDFKVYTLETNRKFAMVAKTMITMAQMDPYVEVITYNPNESSGLALSKTLQQFLPKKRVDFLLLDHDKDRYLPDLKQLESQKWIGTGSYVAADNVIVAPQLQEYRRYLAHKHVSSVVKTRMIEQQLEYSDKNDVSLRDGIELTVYC